MSTPLEVRAWKLFSAIDKAKSSWSRKHGGTPKHEVDTQAPRRQYEIVPRKPIPTYSCWDTLPIELILDIFSFCRLDDIRNLRLVSRAFSHLINVHEEAITKEYLRIRRYGSLPTPTNEFSKYTWAPEDDVILLSDLFPPVGFQGDIRDIYSLRYLSGLRRRQDVCLKVSYHLADQALERFMRSGTPYAAQACSFPKREQQVLLERGRALLQSKLTPLMFYTMFFLDAYAQARTNFKNALYKAFESGQLPVPVQPRDRSFMYRTLQARILQSPPFTDNKTLISTHHCVLLLVFTLHRILMAETPVRAACERFESMLLTSSGLGRIAEFFAAEKGGGNQRALRREFMRKMQVDWDVYRSDIKSLKVFGSDGEDHGDGLTTPPPVREIWIESSLTEMSKRGLAPHNDDDHVMVWEGAVVSIGCPDCAREIGWRA